MKNSNDTIGNQTHDLPACSAVPQPTAISRAPFGTNYQSHFLLSLTTAFLVKIMLVLLQDWGHAVAQWLRHCATNRKVAGSIPDGVIGIFH